LGGTTLYEAWWNSMPNSFLAVLGPGFFSVYRWATTVFPSPFVFVHLRWWIYRTLIFLGLGVWKRNMVWEACVIGSLQEQHMLEWIHTVWKSLNSIVLEIPKNVDVGTDLSRWTVGIRVTERIAGHILAAHHLLQQRDNVWEAHHYVCTVGKAVVPPMFGRFVLTYTSHVWQKFWDRLLLHS